MTRMKQVCKETRKTALVAFAISCFSILFVLGLPNTTHAAPVVGFNPGNIISDGVMTDSNSMNVTQIQNFLNSKVTSCDTNGSQPATDFGRPDLTHAQYAALEGWSAPPYTCLKNYSENGLSAAQIIYNASQQYAVNPEVLIVLLQKEQGLVTDSWPLATQYQKATGYGCPDSTPNCNSSYYGFTNQIDNASDLFHSVITSSPTWYSPFVLGNNNIQWSPNASCGGSTVDIQNLATAALYDYTPYQPNQAALNAGFGTGDSCSSYGNRNFYLYLIDWFNPFLAVENGVSVSILLQPDATPARGEEIEYEVSYTNNLPYDVTLDALGAVGRAGDINTGTNRDFGWQGPITIKAGASQQFTFTTTVQDLGATYMWPAILYQGNYIQYNNWGSTIVSHTPNFSFSQPLTITPTTVYAGQNVTFSAVLKNNEPHAISYDAIGIPVRFYGSYNYDAAWAGPGVVGPGATITLSGIRNIDKPGPYTYWASDYFGGTYTTIGPVNKFSALAASPNFKVSAINFSNMTPAKGEGLTASFTVTNTLPVPIDTDAVGVVGRFGSLTGLNRDIGWQGPVHFDAGETKSFTGLSRNITEVGTQYYWIGILYQGNYIQYNNWGSTIVSHTPNFSFSQPLTITPTTVYAGQNVTFSAVLKNNEPHAISYDAIGIPVRFYGSYNYDAAWAGPGVVGPGATITLSGIRNIDKPGPYTYWASDYFGGTYTTIGPVNKFSALAN